MCTLVSVKSEGDSRRSKSGRREYPSEAPARQDGAAHIRGRVLGASKRTDRGWRQDARMRNSITMTLSIC